jgi:hypothetical protein
MTSLLLAGQQLNVNDRLVPPTGRMVLIMQGDGNLVLYRVDNSAALWASNTWGQPVTHAIMQGNGDFVCYDANGHPHWASGTGGNPGAWVIVEDDGNLVVYSSSNRILWASNTVQTWPVMSAIENVSLVRENGNRGPPDLGFRITALVGSQSADRDPTRRRICETVEYLEPIYAGVPPRR